MTTSFLCFKCSTAPALLGHAVDDPEHCFGEGDEPGTPGVIGSGNHCPCECRTWPHQPHQLWDVAAKAHPDDAEARRDHYLSLMREHGHIVPRQLGQSVNAPCGWPHRPEPDDVQKATDGR